MRTTFVPTNAYYHRILATADAATRQQLYLDLLVQPWKQMMDMASAHLGHRSDDPLAGARAWNWAMPDQMELMAALLEKLEAANAWQVGKEALELAAARFAPYTSRIPIDEISGWLMLGDPARANPTDGGYSGATDWFQPRFISQFWEPDEANLNRLPGLVAHEMHHLIRNHLFAFGPNTTVADYIVIEGTAEAFATALFGEDRIGFYISEFDAAGLEPARRLTGQALTATGFDTIRGYIFGDAIAQQWGFRPVGGMPTFGGYVIGYHVVQAYLKRSGRSIEETTFIPAAEIVRESGFFAE